MAMLSILALLSVLAIVAARYGVDSRDGQDWRPLRDVTWPQRPPRRRYSPSGDLKALAAWFRLPPRVAAPDSRARTATG